MVSQAGDLALRFCFSPRSLLVDDGFLEPVIEEGCAPANEICNSAADSSQTYGIMCGMTDNTDSEAAAHALESSSQEYSEIDSLLIKVATGSLGFSVALGAFQADQQTDWLVASWFSLLLSVVFVLASKYVSAEANRAFYLSKKHKDPDTRKKKATLEQRLDSGVKVTNYVGGGLFLLGTLLLVIHVFAVG